MLPWAAVVCVCLPCWVHLGFTKGGGGGGGDVVEVVMIVVVVVMVMVLLVWLFSCKCMQLTTLADV